MVITKLDRLIDVYADEVAGFRHMLALAQEQADCIAAGNYTVLVEILERRESLAAEIDVLSNQAQALAEAIAEDLGLPELNLTGLRQRLPEAAVAPLADVLAAMHELAEEILQLDAKSAAEMQEAMQGLRGEMGDVQKGQTAMKAYKNAPQANDARFIDKQK